MPTSEQTIVKRLTELVAADSVSSPDPSWDSSNRRVINHLSDYAERDGWAVDIRELESAADGKANLIATLGNTDNLGADRSSDPRCHKQPGIHREIAHAASQINRDHR